MHTTELNSCRIHHHGDYDGDIIITNTDSTSKAIGEKSTITTTYRKLSNLYKSNFGVSNIITVYGNKEKGNIKITISLRDIEAFIMERLCFKIINRLESSRFETITDVANTLNIKW